MRSFTDFRPSRVTSVRAMFITSTFLGRGKNDTGSFLDQAATSVPSSLHVYIRRQRRRGVRGPGGPITCSVAVIEEHLPPSQLCAGQLRVGT